MTSFDPFVLPFTGGVIFLLGLLIYKYVRWISLLSRSDKKILWQGIFRWKFLGFIKEVLVESLIHRRIWKVNPLLGYMHMSLAFGWFALIVVGAIESRVQHDFESEPFWQPIFYKYFQRDMAGLPYAGTFNFLMDLLLLYILSGVILAMVKRIRSRWFGMKKTTRQSLPDQFALASLWLIFPMRLLAESFTAGQYHNGGFLTGNLGKVFSMMLPLSDLSYTTWWIYSITLGVFFVTLPFSRYMHIPTEVLLIAMRKAGLRTGKDFTSFSWIEINSCPRCGICVDKCQLAMDAGITKAPAVYLTRAIRNRNVNPERAFNCLVCGRCSEFCPVQIDISALRITQRKKFNNNNNRNYSYLKTYPVKSAGVAYFAGCMSHLTPTIIRSMKRIFETAGVNYSFIDENGSVCCGRPLLLSGSEDSANKLIEINTTLIRNTGARALVTSCPICYKEFTEKYDLGIEVFHHSQFILDLVRSKKLKLDKTTLRTVYHDPCELGRGSGIFDQPRDLLRAFTMLEPVDHEGKDALCCGGSLGNIMLTVGQRNSIRQSAMAVLQKNDPDVVVTACPLCKKTLNKGQGSLVRDLAELVADSMIDSCSPSLHLESKPSRNLITVK